jgi:hypothetical protein
MAGRQGLEPRYADPESAVLPLDDLPRSYKGKYNKRFQMLFRSVLGPRKVKKPVPEAVLFVLIGDSVGFVAPT